MINQLRQFIARHRQFVFYAIIGSSGVTIDVTLFFILHNLFDVHEGIATAISTTIAITNNFLLNAYLNFRVRDHLLRRYGKFYAVGMSGILLTEVMFWVFVTELGVSANIIKLASLGPVLVLQYTLNKFWTFEAHHNKHDGRLHIEAFETEDGSPTPHMNRRIESARPLVD